MPDRTRNWLIATARERHRPPHRVDGAEMVFVTAATYRRARHLATPARKDDFLSCLLQACEAHEVVPIAWVILDEHYHVILRPEGTETVPGFIKRLHGETARHWNAEEGTGGRQVWYQFWDRNLWTEGDLWSRVHYIHRNPVKHGYTNDPAAWRWSSLSLFGEERELHSDTATRFPPPLRVPNDDF